MLGVLRDSAIGPMIKAVKLSIQNAPRKVSILYPQPKLLLPCACHYFYRVLASGVTRLLPPSTIPLLQLRLMQEFENDLVAFRRIRRQGQAVAGSGLKVDRQSRRGRVELLEGSKIISVAAITTAEAIVFLTNEELNIRQVSISRIPADTLSTYLDGSLERRRRIAKHTPERDELAHAVGLSNLPGVVEERGLKRPLL